VHEEVRTRGRGPVASTELETLLVRSVAEAQGKGGLAAEGLSG
jgi:hypothetical protein